MHFFNSKWICIILFFNYSCISSKRCNKLSYCLFNNEERNVTCQIDNKKVIIRVDKWHDIERKDCSKELMQDMKKNKKSIIEYIEPERNLDNIRNYIKSKGGSCY